MSYIDQLQSIIKEYQAAGQPWPASSHDIAQWALEIGRWAPQRSTLINRCAEEISRALREEYISDSQGRRLRAKHVARIEMNGRQVGFWADVRTAPREHMEIAFQQRRESISADCRQLKTDIDSYNENFNVGQPIQMVFDFTDDLAEAEALLAIA
jgi:hypothetical protein